jgi:hypothetical protein
MKYTIIPAHEAEEMYCSMLDEAYPMVNACGYEYYPSTAIKVLDPIVYETGELEFYDRLFKDDRIAVEYTTDQDLRECEECQELTDDFRGELCKDCDKQAEAGEAND